LYGLAGMRGGRERSRLVGAGAAALLACLSSANGFLLGPVGLAVLLQRKQYGRAIAWILIFAAAVFAYLFQFHSASPSMHVAMYVKPLFFLAVLGGAAPVPLMLPLGLVLVGVFAWSIRMGYARENMTVVLMAVWIVLTAALIAFGRGNYGLGAAHASRYKIYSDLMMIFCYVFVAERLWDAPTPSLALKRRLYFGALLVVSIYCVRADVSAWRLLSQRDGDLRAGLAHYDANPAVNSPMYISDPEVQQEQAVSEDEAVRRILVEAMDAGIYQPPALQVKR
jgi:hypothetical protein